MAEIKEATTQLGDVDITDASFTQRGVVTEQVDTSTADILKFFGGQAKKYLTKNRIAEAEDASRSLLDDFVGGSATAQLDQKQADIDGLVTSDLSDRSRVDGAQPLSEQAQSALRQQRLKLDKDKLAVAQGLLSETEYRIRAEQLYYQQVALSPSLKSELASAMASILRIEPRGQLFQVTADARAAEAQRQKNEDAKLKSILQSQGMWTLGNTDQENITEHWPTFQKTQMSSRKLQQLSTQLTYDDKLTAKKRQELQQGLITAKAVILRNKITFIGTRVSVGDSELDIQTLTQQDIISLDPTKRGLVVQGVRDAFARELLELQSEAAEFQIPEASFKNLVDMLETQEELLIRKVSITEVNASNSNHMKLLEDQRKIKDLLTKIDITKSHPQVQYLSVLSSMIPLEKYLMGQIEVANLVSDILLSKSSNFSGIDDPEVKQSIIKDSGEAIVTMLSSPNKLLERPDEGFLQAATLFTKLAATEPQDVPAVQKHRLLKLINNEPIMSRLEKTDPVVHGQFISDVKEHQAALLSYSGQVHMKFRDVLSQSGRGHLQPSDFHIEKAELSGKYVLVPNTLQDQVSDNPSTAAWSPAASEGNTLAAQRSRREDTTANRERNEAIANEQDLELALRLELNTQQGFIIDDLIRSMTLTNGGYSNYAVSAVIRSLGLSVEDTGRTLVPKNTPN